jgi:hypothetical protein
MTTDIMNATASPYVMNAAPGGGGMGHLWILLTVLWVLLLISFVVGSWMVVIGIWRGTKAHRSLAQSVAGIAEALKRQQK